MNRTTLFIVAYLAYAGSALPGGEYFVSPTGSPRGDGSRAARWDLATALQKSAAVQPGDTLFLGPGTYRGGFASTLEGAEGSPITVRSEPGTLAVIDCRPRDEKDSGLFTVRGPRTVFRDLEFTCSDPRRQTEQKGSWPTDIRRGGIDCRGAHVSFINLVVHDLGNGFGFWGNDEREAGGEIYGCVIYYNGWKGPDRGHGHGIYTQNAVGKKRIVNNIIFNQFGSGIQAYGSQKSALRGFHIEGNILFNNGSLTSAGQRGTDLLVGGLTSIEDITVLQNRTFGGAGVRFGYAWGPGNETLDARENYLGGPLSVSHLRIPRFTANTIITGGTLVLMDLPPNGFDGGHWRQNAYFRTKTEYAAFQITTEQRSRGLSFAQVQSELNIDRDSVYVEGQPNGTKIFLQPNAYQKGRAHLAIYNWDHAPSIDVDLTGLLADGARYRIQDARNFRGAAVVEGVFDGKRVRIPMSPRAPAQPVGMQDHTLPVDLPTFGAFVVLPD